MTLCMGEIDEKLSTRVKHDYSGSSVVTDVPVDIGGEGISFSPTDLLGVSLASCILTTMGLVAKKDGISIAGSSFTVEKHMTKELPRKIGHLIIKCVLPDSIPNEIRDRIESAAHSCPVHHSISPEIKLSLNFNYLSL